MRFCGHCDICSGSYAVPALSEHRLGRYESKEVKAFNRQADSISEYSVELHQAYNLPIKDPAVLKEELWTHFENLVKEVYPTAYVFDIQVALNDSEYLDLLEELRKERYALRLAEARARKCSDKGKSVEEYKEKVRRAQEKVEEYKASFKKAYPVKAFVTFSSIAAADYIKKAYSKCCCRSCIASNKKF